MYSANNAAWSVVLVSDQLCRVSANAACIKSHILKCRLSSKYYYLVHMLHVVHTLTYRGSPNPSYRLIGPVDPDQEQWLSDEEADAEVLVDGVAVALQPAEEAKGEDADE